MADLAIKSGKGGEELLHYEEEAGKQVQGKDVPGSFPDLLCKRLHLRVSIPMKSIFFSSNVTITNKRAFFQGTLDERRGAPSSSHRDAESRCGNAMSGVDAFRFYGGMTNSNFSSTPWP